MLAFRWLNITNRLTDSLRKAYRAEACQFSPCHKWSANAVLFNLFCYGAHWKIFWRTHAPYLLALLPCPPT